MTEGIRKQDLPNFLLCLKDIYSNDNEYMQDYDVEKLLAEYCKELDPWLPIDDNTPKDQDILITDKSKRKYICRLFSSGIWCTQGKLDFIPTHYKLLK